MQQTFRSSSRELLASRRKLLFTVAGISAALALPWPGRARAARLEPDARCALIVIDVQNCFLPGGTLAVTNGEVIVPVINRLAAAFDTVIVTQDWHTPGHVSFASAHPDRRPYDSIDLSYGSQMLWPDHCVQGTDDAELYKELDVSRAQLIIRKGYHRDMDSYSAFEEADHKTATGLRGYLEARRVRSVFLAGLATDFCVASTALDARKAGFTTYVIEDACRGIDLEGSLASAWQRMKSCGVHRIQSTDILA